MMFCEGYHKNGKLEYKGTFLNNTFHGLYEQFHSNGELFLIGHYNNGKEIGVWYEYLDGGELIEKYFFI